MMRQQFSMLKSIDECRNFFFQCGRTEVFSVCLQEESFDVVKRAQLRELAILNGTLREDPTAGQNFVMMGGQSPQFPDGGMKRAKTRR